MDELYDQLETETDVPATLLERSAQARAQAMGVAVDDLVRQWAGVAGDTSPAAVEPAPAAAEAVGAPEAVVVESVTEEPDAGEADVQVLVPTADLPEPDVDAAEDAEEDIAEPLGGVPGWLAAAFALIPILAVMYALSIPNGPDCGSSGQLQVDPVTGNAVNCDGSEYGSTEGNLLATGQTLYDAGCAACHGASGGGGAGPALNGGAVLTTFPSCSNHIEWVDLGSAGWPESTYGDTDKPVGGFGQMPGFGGQLSEEELAAVSLYERVAFGGEDLDLALEDCSSSSEVAALGRSG